MLWQQPTATFALQLAFLAWITSLNRAFSSPSEKSTTFPLQAWKEHSWLVYICVCVCLCNLLFNIWCRRLSNLLFHMCVCVCLCNLLLLPSLYYYYYFSLLICTSSIHVEAVLIWGFGFGTLQVYNLLMDIASILLALDKHKSIWVTCISHLKGKCCRG